MRGNLYFLVPPVRVRVRVSHHSMTKKQSREGKREKRDRDGGREHLIKRFECPNQQQSALSRVRKTALLPPSPLLLPWVCGGGSGSDAMIRPLEPPPPPPAAAAISRATHNTTHTDADADGGREGGATNGGSIRGQRESPKGPFTNDASREGGGGLPKFCISRDAIIPRRNCVKTVGDQIAPVEFS